MCKAGNLARGRILVGHFVSVCVMEYDGHVGCQNRQVRVNNYYYDYYGLFHQLITILFQDVCEHFVSILKVISSFKAMILKCYPDVLKKENESGWKYQLNLLIMISLFSLSLSLQGFYLSSLALTIYHHYCMLHVLGSLSTLALRPTSLSLPQL